MSEKLHKALASIGSLYDFEPYRGVEIEEKTPLRYLSTAFEYVGNGLKTTATEIESTREGKPKQLELVSTD